MNFAAAVIEAAPDGIMLVSREGVVELANPRAEQLFGTAVAGRRLDALIEEASVPVDVSHAALGERVIDEHAVELLRKPYTVKELRRRVTEALQ